MKLWPSEAPLGTGFCYVCHACGKAGTWCGSMPAAREDASSHAAGAHQARAVETREPSP